MTGAELLRFLAGERSCEIELGGRNVRLGIVPARELLAVKREAEAYPTEDENAAALIANATLLAHALSFAGGRLYSGAEELLKVLSAEEIAGLMRLYIEMSESVDISAKSEAEQIAALKDALGENGYERLKWQVLKAFHALPTEARVREMTQGDYLYCILNILLDAEEELDHLCPSCREKARSGRCPACGGTPADRNEGFDEGRFEELMRRD